MKCLICGGDSAGEVCNKCSRLEKILYQKEWTHKEGLIIKKTEGFRIAISNMRISGRVAVSENPKGLNARLDNMSHYLLNIKECTQTTYQGKKTVMVVLENKSVENANYTRYCFLPGFEEADQFVAAIAEGKQKAETLADKIRHTNSISSNASASVSVTRVDAEPTVPVRTVAPTLASESASVPTPASAPTSESTPVPTPVSAPTSESTPVPTPVSAPTSESTPASTPVSASTSESAPASTPTTTSYDTVALSSIASDINEFETKIKKLKVLRDNGILSEEEYLAEKKKLVSIF